MHMLGLFRLHGHLHIMQAHLHIRYLHNVQVRLHNKQAHLHSGRGHQPPGAPAPRLPRSGRVRAGAGGWGGVGSGAVKCSRVQSGGDGLPDPPHPTHPNVWRGELVTLLTLVSDLTHPA